MLRAENYRCLQVDICRRACQDIFLAAAAILLFAEKKINFLDRRALSSALVRA
jgi:hypothetical protein